MTDCREAILHSQSVTPIFIFENIRDFALLIPPATTNTSRICRWLSRLNFSTLTGKEKFRMTNKLTIGRAPDFALMTGSTELWHEIVIKISENGISESPRILRSRSLSHLRQTLTTVLRKRTSYGTFIAANSLIAVCETQANNLRVEIDITPRDEMSGEDCQALYRLYRRILAIGS